MKKKNRKQNEHMPEFAQNESVEYSEELADVEDREAQARAKAASQRVNTDKI